MAKATSAPSGVTIWRTVRKSRADYCGGYARDLTQAEQFAPYRAVRPRDAVLQVLDVRQSPVLLRRDNNAGEAICRRNALGAKR